MPNQDRTKIITDLSYIPTTEGWLYLAGFNDLFSGELVGFILWERG